jgi:hypothetical protein
MGWVLGAKVGKMGLLRFGFGVGGFIVDSTWGIFYRIIHNKNNFLFPVFIASI